jgi:hypothetical protein
MSNFHAWPLTIDSTNTVRYNVEPVNIGLLAKSQDSYPHFFEQ